MSDPMHDPSRGEAERPGRRRPSYGLPGPAQQSDPGQHSVSAQHPGSTQQPSPHDSAESRIPASLGSAPTAPSRVPGVRPRRRRGLVSLIVGLVLLLVVAPAVTFGGIIWAMASLVGHVDQGPIALDGPTSQVEVSANEMLIVYVPEEDAARATCTATGSPEGSVTAVASSGEVQFADGTRYQQKLGVVATQDSTVTVTCEGTDAPVRLGPLSLVSVAVPLLAGPLIGVVVGLVGLVLAIVGLVRLLRSRPQAAQR